MRRPLLKNKPLRLQEGKIAKTEEETMDRALGRIIREEQEKTRGKNLMSRILALRHTLGKMEEDPAEWVRAARRDRPIH